MAQEPSERLHIIEGTNWKEAVIALLEPRSRVNPWRYGFGEVHQGDPVAVVLDTDPCSVLTVLGHVGADGDLSQIVFDIDGSDAGLLDLATLTLLTGLTHDEDPRWGWMLHGDAAIKMQLALRDCCLCGWDASLRFGHTSLASARILLHSNGDCAACSKKLDISGTEGGAAVHIHTVDTPQRPAPAPPITVRHPRQRGYGAIAISDKRNPPDVPDDWPAVLCQRCHSTMQQHGYTRFLDYRFSLHPPCPACQARRTQRALFGLLSSATIDPWLDPRGCCVTEDRWTCTQCMHTW